MIGEEAVAPPFSGYVPRRGFILERCAGGRVLHLGCVGETEADSQRRAEFVSSPRSLHGELRSVAGELLGVDWDTETINRLSSMGCRDIVWGNVEHLETIEILAGRTFDVVLAGDLIEHLSNPAMMLEGSRRLVSVGGCLILSTPNAYGLPNFLRFLVGRYREGVDHVQSYSILTLGNLLKRHGWSLDQVYGCYQENASIGIPKPLFVVGKWLLQKKPHLGGTLLCVCVPTG